MRKVQRNTRALSLSRETLRKLNERQLRGIAGNTTLEDSEIDPTTFGPTWGSCTWYQCSC